MVTETAGSAGGGVAQKSFSRGRRVKRAAKKRAAKFVKEFVKRAISRLRAVGPAMQVKDISVRLETRADKWPL